MKKNILSFLCITFLACLLVSFTAFAQELPIVTIIEVKGLKRIDEAAIRAKLSQKIREPLAQEKTSEDIKSIYKMGYFDDVKVEIEPFEGGIKVIYIIREKPTIIRVDFQGNKEFDEAKLKEKVTIIPGAISDITLINDNAVKLKAFYEDEGYYLAQVVPVVRKVTEGEVAVTYQIEEGEKVKIKEIRIEGNSAISAKAIKKAMKTAERGIFSFITGTGYYKKDVMKEDVERIKDVYYNNGYLKVIVQEPKIELIDNKKGMRISIAVIEREQFTVSSVDITGNKAVPKEQIQGLVKMTPNKIFSREVLKKDVVAISDLYSNSGYALVSVSPDLVPDDVKKDTKVIYKIDEGDKFKIGRIEISGNTKTRDKVIRREIRLDEGDLFNASSLKRSYERLNNLQYFETIDIVPKPKADQKVVDLDVKVKEKPTGYLSIGGGYSSIDKLIGMVDVTQSNLFGRGQFVKLRAELGGESSFYELSFRDPWFLDKPLSFGASIYNTNRDYGNYERKATGFGITLGKSFGEYYFGSVAYNFEDATIFNVREDASQQIKDQEGSGTTSGITLTGIRDTRDNVVDPTRGSKNAVYYTFAGLGGSRAFHKVLFDSGWYFPVFDVTAFFVRGRLGYAQGLYGKELPLYERYYVGGIYTVRGLGYGQAGPKDINGEPVGGEKELIFNFEYIFPVLAEFRVKGVVFFDVGRAYLKDESLGTDLRYTAGVGVRWLSPFGPLRIEWGWNIDRREDEDQSKIEFSFGSVF
ncbi:MAG TPA: outer membrane protein assembly factor BamA [Dissulfurispiraceae bacterium]|nr:outer membrane protein assembly factor BamA [Dissulfurispiraceae bacterium]